MTTSIRSASATALPSAIPALDRSMPRRGFLAGLTRLPLIGGSVALLGQPSAVAEPVTLEVVEAYKTWLSAELSALTWQMSDDVDFIEKYRNCYTADADRETRRTWMERYNWFIGDSNSHHENPYSRAALVMSAVGCDWRDRDGIFDLRRRA